MVACCANSVSLDIVLITMPSEISVAQAGNAFLEFSTSTRHIRQFAAIESFSW